MRKPSRKKCKKEFDGNCFFCEILPAKTDPLLKNTKVLDGHRIIPGENNGKYNQENVLTCCPTHHRMLHESKEIVVDRKYMSTGGPMLHWFFNNEEFWSKVKS